MITSTLFKLLFPRAKDAETWVQNLNQYCPRYDINTPEREAAFLAQTGHESAGYTVLSENLNYSAEALLRVWPKYFKTRDVNEYARHPEKIANVAYANRMGNGPESSGDGWKYRGRGLIQLTGRSNYRRFADFIADEDVYRNPDLVAQPQYAILSACWYWQDNHLNTYADSGDIELLTRRINGGLHGLKERTALYRKALAQR